MDTTREVAEERVKANAMEKNDTRLGMAYLNRAMHPFLVEYTGLQESTIEHLRVFMASCEDDDTRARSAKILADKILNENPRHHSLRIGDPKAEVHQYFKREDAPQVVNTLADKLLSAATLNERKWFVASVAANKAQRSLA